MPKKNEIGGQRKLCNPTICTKLNCIFCHYFAICVLALQTAVLGFNRHTINCVGLKCTIWEAVYVATGHERHEDNVHHTQTIVALLRIHLYPPHPGNRSSDSYRFLFSS